MQQIFQPIAVEVFFRDYQIFLILVEYILLSILVLVIFIVVGIEIVAACVVVQRLMLLTNRQVSVHRSRRHEVLMGMGETAMRGDITNIPHDC